MIRPSAGLLLLLIVTVGCGREYTLRVPGQSSSPDRYFVQVGEGITAATLTEGIRVSPRMFTPNDLTIACRELRPVARLEVVPSVLDLQVDGRYPLNRISVVAINPQGVAVVPGVPIVLEAQDITPPIVLLRSDDPDLSAGVLHGVRPGSFRLRARMICGSDRAEVTVRGNVR